ncbi:RNA cytidine acetyltransferase [Trichonephila inaurata madagascariensis]|uniref:RNA cytidine acetyltransferase n=1 Tax=Trichonephila inaurata madagascariensis TaxID=2747483 RepID=A0A8X6XRV9_9ARAC|nr:RNA cytidine acetyltransferase [Trichonephila inaurata madagascariensis]
MVRKKLDNRIRVLIENCVNLHHRSLFVIVGEKARNNIPILHEILSKAEVRARPSVLWCYKKDLGFSSNKRKQKKLKKALATANKHDLDEFDSIEYFISSTNIRYCYYSETHSIMGQTFGMAILQDFEALTPNLLARTVETVEGGGVILILLQTITSIKQLYTMAMDVHARYRTEAYQHVVCRFNERFILSLSKCSNCLFLDDKLNILPIHSSSMNLKPVPAKSLNDPKTLEEQKLLDLKASFDGTQPMHVLVKKCKTFDQAEAVMKFIDSLSEKTLRSTVTLTSGRGRGKSAALGLAVAAAIAFKYPNIAVTSPHPENLKTFFTFLLEGLDALGYEKATDFEEIRSSIPEHNKAIIQINVMGKLKQRVRYIQPNSTKLDNLELLVIDEAAAIPLPFVKALMGPYLIFLASTINGYEGTGRSLSLKLISQLRKQSNENTATGENKSRRSITGRILHELTLDESIRYKKGDKVEEWLNNVLCLNATIPPVTRSSSPSHDECKLYYVNRDTLFSYHKDAEKFLQNLVAILVASHYKNSPNDLQMMSDAPAHNVFCLCAPQEEKASKGKHTVLPEILCVLQVCLEGKLTEKSVKHELRRGKRGAGDLIPWIVSQEFSQDDFPSLSGARIIRIATHPEYQGKGYGLLALKLLQDFYEGKFYLNEDLSSEFMDPVVYNDVEMTDDVLEEKFESQSSLPTLFPPLNKLKPEVLDYLGVSYGLSEQLLRFWQRALFYPVYLSFIPNKLTGEHSCIMLKQLAGSTTKSIWLPSFSTDFCWKLIESILWLKLEVGLAFNLVSQDNLTVENQGLSRLEILNHLDEEALSNLKEFCTNPTFGFPPKENIVISSKFYFTHRLNDVQLNKTEAMVLLSYGILRKPFEVVAENLKMCPDKVKENFMTGFKKIAFHVVNIYEN